MVGFDDTLGCRHFHARNVPTICSRDNEYVMRATATQWRHQVVAMLDLRPGASEGSPAMCVHGMPPGLVGAGAEAPFSSLCQDDL